VTVSSTNQDSSADETRCDLKPFLARRVGYTGKMSHGQIIELFGTRKMRAECGVGGIFRGVEICKYEGGCCKLARQIIPGSNSWEGEGKGRACRLVG
jgi:hypothetical protein